MNLEVHIFNRWAVKILYMKLSAALIYDAQQGTQTFFLWQQHDIIETASFYMKCSLHFNLCWVSALSCDPESTDVLLFLKVI